jgi:hypothetical protein
MAASASSSTTALAPQRLDQAERGLLAPAPPAPAAAADVARRIPAWETGGGSQFAGVPGSGDKLGPPIIVARETARLARRSSGRVTYFDGGFAPGLGASACGLRKVEPAGVTFLSAFGFLASRLPRRLSPLPMVVLPATVRCSSCGAAGCAGESGELRAARSCKRQMHTAPTLRNLRR